MLSKIFGKKKSGYFLELKEEDSQQAAKPEVSAKPQAEKPAEAATQAPAVEEKPAEPAPTSSKTKKSSIKSKKATKSPEKQPEKQPEQEPSSVPLISSFPASATSASQNGKAEPQEVAFASKYLLTPTLSRRRPGPSLSTYKNMARQVKKPK